MRHLSVFAVIGMMLLGSMGKLLSQCDAQIPGWAIVVDNSNTGFSASSDTFWVCKGDTTNITGNNNVVYLEENAYIDITGDSNKCYVKTGAYCEISGDYDSTYYESGALISNAGTGSLNMPCLSVDFDYTLAPVSGCPDVGALLLTVEDEFRIYPNPAKEILNVLLEKKQGIVDLKIIDYLGRTVLEVRKIRKIRSEIDVSALKPGFYVIELKWTDYVITHNLMIE